MAETAKKISMIPAKVQYDRNVKLSEKKMKVAAYCRVSTELEEQDSSYEAQVEYYTSKISENDWKLRFSANCSDGLSAGVRKQSLRTLCRRPNRRKLTFLSAMLLLRNRMGLFKCVPIWEMRKPEREKSALCKRLCNVPTLIPA